ncbi:MAG: conjugal transfer protein TrbF, partial [Rhodocyclaceae bacterium]|nr:conjugal transfer protein TrbF [Rhodocyclaceae bacterium]
MSLRDTVTSLLRRQAPITDDADPRQLPQRIEGGRRAGESDNPYTTARRTWNDHVGGVMVQRRNWQIIGILALLIALA